MVLGAGAIPDVAVHKETETYRTSWWAFPLEALPPAIGESALGIFLGSCSPEVFADGFESGDTSIWSTTVPAP